MKSKKNFLDAAMASRLDRCPALRGCALLAGAIALLGVLALCLLLAASFAVPMEAAAPMAAILPFLGLLSPLCESDKGPGGGGTGDPVADKILARIAETKKATEELHTKFAELDGEAKGLAEEQAKIVSNFDGLTSDVKAFTETIRKMEAKIANERRSNGMGALQRIQSDREMKTAINHAIRAAYRIQKNRSEDGLPKEWLDAHRAIQAIAEGRTITGGGTPGSTYLNDALIPELYSLVAEYGVWSQFDVLHAGARTNKLLVDGADPVMGVVGEGVAPDESDPQGGTVSATVVKLLGWIGVATELLEDAETDVSGILLRKFSNATAYRLDWFCTQADGGSDAVDGGMTGIFGGGGTAAVAASGNVSIATHDFEDWFKPLTVVAPSVLTRSARWWIHPTLLVKVLGIKDGSGRSIFLPGIDAPAFGALGSILGYPVSLTHAAPTADTTSSKIAVFGDPAGQAVLLRKDMQFVASDQAKFTEDEVVFRCRARAASKVRQATAFGVLTNAAS